MKLSLVSIASVLACCALYSAEPASRVDPIEVGSKWRNNWLTLGDWELHTRVLNEKPNLFTITKFENGRVGLVQMGADTELATTWLSEEEFRANFKKFILPPRITQVDTIELIPRGIPLGRDHAPFAVAVIRENGK